MEIMRRTGISKPTVWRWQARYLEAGVDGLLRDKSGRRGRRRSSSIHWNGSRRPDGLRDASSHLELVGLYLDPPDKAVVFSVDEKSQIQALDRSQPGLPMKKGRAGTMTHDYKRHGTTTLFAALNLLDGKVIGHCMKRHRHQEFIRFLNRIDRQTLPYLDIHLIIDIAYYEASWLSASSPICIRRGVFKSVGSRPSTSSPHNHNPLLVAQPPPPFSPRAKQTLDASEHWVIRVLTVKGTPAATDFGSFTRGLGSAIARSSAAAADRHRNLLGGLAERAVRHLRHRIHVLAPGKPDADRGFWWHQPPELENGDARIRVSVVEERDAPGALGNDPDRHSAAVVEDLRRIEKHTAFQAQCAPCEFIDGLPNAVRGLGRTGRKQHGRGGGGTEQQYIPACWSHDTASSRSPGN